MVIESKKSIRICSKCNKTYEDEQILINNVPCCKYALCSECSKEVQTKLISSSNK